MKKKVKIIPLIIAIIFPVVITTFILCYSYGVNDVYTTNKLKYENEVYYQYYDEDNCAEGEIEKNIKFISNNYREINPTINSSYTNDFKTKMYAYTYYGDTLTDGDSTESKEYFNISLFIYDINYRTYKKSDSFQTSGIVLDSNSSIAVLYVKGIGEPANDRIYDAVEELKTNSLASATLIDSYETSFIDHNAVNTTDETYAYKASFINSTKGDDVLTYDDLEDIYDSYDLKYLENGYTCAIINYYSVDSSTNLVKVVSTFTTSDIEAVDSFDAREDIQKGYKESFDLAGYSYISYIWPTLLWQGVLSLVLTGILGVLFYAIWSSDNSETEQEKKVSILKKEIKKGSK